MYQFKWQPEMIWALVTAALTYLMTVLATDFAAVTDWRAFAISVAAGLARAVIAAFLAMASGSFRSS